MRHNNQLPDNLPQLQNLIKRDPDSYRDEFNQQYRHFNSILEIFRLDPSQQNKSLEDLVIFLAQVSKIKMKKEKKLQNITPHFLGGSMLRRRIGSFSTATG